MMRRGSRTGSCDWEGIDQVELGSDHGLTGYKCSCDYLLLDRDWTRRMRHSETDRVQIHPMSCDMHA